MALNCELSANLPALTVAV